MKRPWYELPLALLGLALIAVGLPFFVLVYSVGAPVVPFAGLLIAGLGFWFLFIHRFISKDRSDSGKAEE